MHSNAPKSSCLLKDAVLVSYFYRKLFFPNCALQYNIKSKEFNHITTRPVRDIEWTYSTIRLINLLIKMMSNGLMTSSENWYK